MKYLKLSEICNPKQWKTLSTEQLLDKGFPVYGANGKIGYYSTYNHELPTIMITCRGATCGSINISEPKSWINGNAMCLDNLSSDVSLKYLAFYLQNYNFNHVISGSAQPQITREGLEKVKVKVYAKELQEKISIQLDKVQKIISESKAILEKYDTLIKSRFIEMFGNPQCISNNWKVNPLSDYCIVNPKKSELGPIPDDYELSFIPMQSVSENGDVDTSSIKHYKDVKTGFTYFRENDVLFAKITPCMENGKGGVARKLKNQIGFGSTEFHVLRPIETISNSEWIYRLTTFKTFRKDAENNMTGSAGQRRTPKEFFDKYKVGLPPIELQNDFAAFVQQIDKSKFEMEKIVKLCYTTLM